ncbi:alpha/beta hydrolase family protein [Methylomonas rhizoryzae]|uniref:alpha/beta hydrolase family protein n=1 Tax=Methylomonas rhizoryzae TaxID=2608981 RepID=UPI0016800CB4|nr:alpha/beta fold hydrolase [Methylomonas rhizoryzae]
MHGLAARGSLILLLAILSLNCSGPVARVSEEFVPEVPLRNGELPLTAFAALPLIQNLALSPSGDYTAFIQNTEGHSALVTQDRSGRNSCVVLSTDNDKYHIRGFTWVNDRRLLVSVWYPDHAADLKFIQTRMFAVNLDGSELKSDLVEINIPSFAGRFHIPQFQDTYALIPKDDRHILLALDQRQPGAPDMYRLDVYSGERKTVAGNPGFVRRWLADLQGRVRIGIGIVGSKTMRVVHRTNDESDWQTLFEFDALSGDAIAPLGFDENPEALYVTKQHQGKAAVFKMRVSAPQSAMELVYADSKYDVNGILVYSAAGYQVLGIRYTADTEKTVYWHPHAGHLQTAIDTALPDRENTIISSAGSQHILVSSSAAQAPGYYWLDSGNNRMGKLIDAYPLLSGQTLAQSQSVHFKTRDGLELEGYLTRPTRINAVSPAIVFPHGGPWSRDSHGFDIWTQFFANRGWTVLQLNFRGSAGYGREFESAGFRRWGLAMQDDISDGVHWLLEQGLATPGRICIVGASYGGYAALMGAIKTSELYQCAISFAPVTDLRHLIEEWSDMRWQDHRLRSEQAEHALGRWWSDRTRLKETSPLEQASRMRTPLLLAHGADDWTVHVGHSRDMVDALESAGFKDLVYLELSQGDHYLSREADRTRFFSEMDKFLHRFN